MASKTEIASKSLSALVAAALFAGCAGTPPRSLAEVDRLQSELTRLRNDPQLGPLAPPELHDAQLAVDLLAADGRVMSREAYDHSLYLAERLVAIAEAEARARHAERRALQLDGERERLLVDARRELRDAERAASARARADAEAAQAAAAAARAEASAARQALADMQFQLSELQTRQTERGLVVTLGDVLFETGRADLKRGSERSLEQLAAVLRGNPHAVVTIEGHTDAVGSRGFNLELSEDRAEAVRRYLISHGVPAERIVARGLGPDFPVASNADIAGRQQNRRVEVLIRQTS